MSELKPCPFCGSGKILRGKSQPFRVDEWFIACRDCHAEISGGDNNPNTLLNRWNTRPGEDGLKNEIEERIEKITDFIESNQVAGETHEFNRKEFYRIAGSDRR